MVNHSLCVIFVVGVEHQYSALTSSLRHRHPNTQIWEHPPRLRGRNMGTVVPVFWDRDVFLICGLNSKCLPIPTRPQMHLHFPCSRRPSFRLGEHASDEEEGAFSISFSIRKAQHKYLSSILNQLILATSSPYGLCSYISGSFLI